MVALIAVLAGLSFSALGTQLGRQKLARSAERLGSHVELTRAYAMQGGTRHRLVWPETDEVTRTDQPAVEHEADPIDAPGEFVPVPASWARPKVLADGIVCREVVLGAPPVDDDPFGFDDDVARRDEGRRPPVEFDPTGRVEQATLIVARDDWDEIDEESQWRWARWVVIDPRTGRTSVRTPPRDDPVYSASDGEDWRLRLLVRYGTLE